LWLVSRDGSILPRNPFSKKLFTGLFKIRRRALGPFWENWAPITPDREPWPKITYKDLGPLFREWFLFPKEPFPPKTFKRLFRTREGVSALLENLPPKFPRKKISAPTLF